MTKIIISLLLIGNVCLAQQTNKKPTTYKHGQNGIEIIAKNSNGMVVVSTYNAKVTIKDEIAEKVMELYNKNTIPNQLVSIDGKEAKVTGKYSVEKKNNLTSVKFVYEKIEWKNGLVEVSE